MPGNTHVRKLISLVLEVSDLLFGSRFSYNLGVTSALKHTGSNDYTGYLND